MFIHVMTAHMYVCTFRLIPKERDALMQALDEDGGGEIDVQEFEEWWNSTPLLPTVTRLRAAAKTVIAVQRFQVHTPLD
jgi:hypothetical protein